jgi:Tol biopolymer transport system component
MHREETLRRWNRATSIHTWIGQLATAAVVGSSVLASSCRAAQPVAAPDAPQVQSVITLRTPGGQVDWSPSENLIAYDAPGADGIYRLHVMAPDGSGDRCLSCAHPGLPKGHHGAPTWHPQGRYIVFLVEKANHPGISYEALPGFGQYCDLWAITPDGAQVFQLTDLPNARGSGVLMPHFSHDGYYLSWTQMKSPPNLFDPAQRQTMGYWSLRTARFGEIEGRPHLSQEKVYEPTVDAFYENDGFTPDGTQLMFTGNAGGQSVWQSQVYLLDLASGVVSAQLTSSQYNEHPVFSPDGARILWMSNQDNGANGATDWWIMQADGSSKQRVTYFNKWGSGQFRGKVWATDSSWSPDGRSFVGYIQNGLISQRGPIVRVELR